MVGSNDFWKYNIATKEWTWLGGNNQDNDTYYGVKGIEDPSNYPPAKMWIRAAVDPDGNAYIFGGYKAPSK